MLELDAARTALVLVDLQKGIVSSPLSPRSGEAVVATCARLADRFRTAGAPVVLVRVEWAVDFADAPSQKVDKPMPKPEGGLPSSWGDLAEGLRKPGDIVVTKRHWGAFNGTDLDLQLRRRGVQTIVLCGIATNFGVESTARQAWEQSYDVVLVEDACSSASADLHGMAIRDVLPRLARVCRADRITLGAP